MLEADDEHTIHSFIHSFIRGGGWPLAVFRRAFQPTASAEAQCAIPSNPGAFTICLWSLA